MSAKLNRFVEGAPKKEYTKDERDMVRARCERMGFELGVKYSSNRSNARAFVSMRRAHTLSEFECPSRYVWSCINYYLDFVWEINNRFTGPT